MSKMRMDTILVIKRVDTEEDVIYENPADAETIIGRFLGSKNKCMAKMYDYADEHELRVYNLKDGSFKLTSMKTSKYYKIICTIEESDLYLI